MIRAPFDGVVAEVGVKRGEFAPPGQPVVRVIALDPVKVTLSVADRDVVALAEGMPAMVSTAASAAVVPGVVSHIAPASDLRTRAFPVEVLVENGNRQLLPGMIAQVTVERTVEAGAFVIPQDWLVTQRDDRGVFVVDGEVARWRSLQLGQVVQQTVVVTGGLDGSEQIVITGHRELVDGDPLLIARRGQCCTAGRVVFGG